MFIRNLQLHGSTDPNFSPYYTADLVEANEEGNETVINVEFSRNVGRDDWTAYDHSTGNAYPVLFVGCPNNPNKMNDITTWEDGDCIELGVCIPRP